jgi:hypothetical protein
MDFPSSISTAMAPHVWKYSPSSLEPNPLGFALFAQIDLVLEAPIVSRTINCWIGQMMW